MRILFLSLSYVPSRRASSVQVTRMCDALARAGHAVTLVAKRGAPHALADHAFYGVAPGFEIVKLARPARRGGGLVFTAAVLRELVRRRGATDLVYARDVPGAWLAARAGLPIVLETHGVPRAGWLRVAWRDLMRRPQLRGVVAISNALHADLAAADLLPRGAPTVIAHDAADPPPLAEAVAEVAGGAPRIGYVGHLYPGRGVELVVALARAEPGWRIDIVGGSEPDLAHWRGQQLPANVTLHGFVPPSQLPAIYRGLDVVLMPYARTGIGVASGGSSDTSRWCSPMKMFEYMASGVPLVSSDLPVLQEVLRHEHNALIAPAGDVAAWRAAVHRLLAEPALARRLADHALADLRRDYTWDARVARITRGLGLPAA